MVTSQSTQIHSRRDVDDLIENIQMFADEMEQRARNDVTLDISQVFAETELADELLSYAAAFEALVCMPIDLAEDVWTALEDVAREAKPGSADETRYLRLCRRVRDFIME